MNCWYPYNKCVCVCVLYYTKETTNSLSLSKLLCWPCTDMRCDQLNTPGLIMYIAHTPYSIHYTLSNSKRRRQKGKNKNSKKRKGEEKNEQEKVESKGNAEWLWKIPGEDLKQQTIFEEEKKEQERKKKVESGKWEYKKKK